ncbi:arsenate reductase ArsC [Thioflexithrix psekupsensis]|uniref:Low molecular weight phosphatase family protein n=1 Tax=Thioflexithrix psekupsensis TaxID=1570016 RepID=A0A251X4Q1_9GAMM|nr:arsenate reductase ArsC [Thioflexithrix psekupsensis]OUD12360.1 low molecular weight phosphatase family protein [Thioflexithrix psekupsensis]
MRKKGVLFVCIHNSARSQMAEAWFNHFCSEEFFAESAGIEPGTLNPLAVAAMQEVGIDISQKKTQSVFELFKASRIYAYVVTVCDETSAERCPIFPGVTTRINWSFPDPSQFQGTEEERLEQARAVSLLIKARVKNWCREIGALNPNFA